jgi:peptidoglycan hydrolase-like protein with peptidoglycan-binding domain
MADISKEEGRMTIKQRQNLLAYLGYYVGNIDGSWGQLSKTATVAFQKDFGLKADGICGAETEKALKHAVAYGIDKKQEATEEPTDGDFWDGIKYWSREEFRCQCGGKYCNGFPAEPSEKLARLADDVRGHFGKPGHRSSGLRCKTWNAIQGGVANSKHLTGRALDFRIQGETSASVLAYVKTLPGVNCAYQIDSQHVHMDVL